MMVCWLSSYDLTKYWLHNDLASGVQCLAFRGTHFRRHTLFYCGERVDRLGLRLMVLLAPRCDVRIKPSVL